MKICIVIDQYPLPPRARKIRDSLLKMIDGSDVHFFVWNRNNEVISEEFVYSYNQNISYGQQAKKLLHLWGFKRALQKHLQEQKIDILHGIDLEMALVCALNKKNRKLIYEVYDIKFFSLKVLDGIRMMIEKFVIRNVSGVIYASPFFENYYVSHGFKPVFSVVINNRPSRASVSGTQTKISDKSKSKTIGFIGVIRYKEILVQLIDAVSELPQYRLLLAGSGPDQTFLRQYIEQKNLSDRIVMSGRFEISDLVSLYDQTDIIWAAYPNKDTNVYYAVSNKFFESMAFKKIVIVSENTLLAQWVIREKLGYTVDPYDKISIKNLLEGLDSDDTSNINESQILFWEDEESVLRNIYKHIGEVA